MKESDKKKADKVASRQQAGGANPSATPSDKPAQPHVSGERTQVKQATAQSQQQRTNERTVFGRNQPVKQKPVTDKTRVKQPQQAPAAASGDRTVFGRANNTAQPQQAATGDKTRVRTSHISPRNTGEHTVFGRNEATQVKTSNPAAQPQANHEATRVPQTNQSSAPGAAGDDKATSGGSHRVLKGRFMLEKVLGVGGMGVVYKAKDRLKVEAKDREPYVAIKVLSEEFKSHPESFIALQREARKAQRIAHPNTVKVYDFDRDGDVVFMTMEFMEGKPLDQMIRQYHATGLPRDDAWHIIDGMCSALVHAHEENIVHSDFKPGNVFVTDSGMAKIFDFGIARAVANVDRHSGKAMDKTVFDAGSLGALTPAYASLEMLQGKEPDIRDDIYALGCIVYEMLTGEHPFSKIPADEAYKKGLKPRRIPSVTKRQWKAIERSLAFKRADRVATVEEFHKLLRTKSKPKYMLVTALLIVGVAITALAVVQFLERRQVPNTTSADDIRSELEFTIRYDLYKEKINKLLDSLAFTPPWEKALYDEYSGVLALFPGEPDKWVVTTRNTIYRKYIDKINEQLESKEFKRAGELIENAYRYTTDSKLLTQLKHDLDDAISSERVRRNAIAKNARDKAASKKAKPDESKTTQAAKNANLFALALKNVNQQLVCQEHLSMRDLRIAVNKLRETDPVRYKNLEGEIVRSLASCITQIGKVDPAVAQENKKSALRIFPKNALISAIEIKARDACAPNLAGLGGRGNSAICRDKLARFGSGPALVVIPGNGNSKPFAIGKYEVSVKEFNLYCKATKACSPDNNTNHNFPVTNIGISSVKGYLEWLSKTSKQRYRLPRQREWVYAAKTRSVKLDPNRHCFVDSRGFSKDGLIKTNTGKPNSWGLVNYVGNAQEWVYDSGKSLVAVGGSYRDDLSKCTINTSKNVSGAPDEATGFRVLREMAR